MSIFFGPHREMKSLGVLWLGEVPAHWEVKPARALFAEVKDQNRPDEPLLSVTIARGVIRQTDLLVDSSKKDSSNQDKAKYKLVLPGDIAYNKMRAWQGAVGCSSYRGIVSPAYIVQRPRPDVSARFMHYLLRTPDFAKEAERWSYGITSDQWSLRPEHFKMIYCCLPPPDEQSAIVRFLDNATRRIGQAIGAKQRLIKLLEQERQVIIHHAVTRGLDSNVRLKPSGIEWLGDIPDHWKVVRLGRRIELVTGFPFKSDGFTQGAGDIRLLRGINISPKGIRWVEVVRWPLSEHGKYRAFDLHVGDIVLGMDRPIIHSGTRVATVSAPDVPALLLQRVARIRPRDGLQCEFLTLLLAGKSFADYLTPIFTGISVPHLSPEQIKSFCFALPTEDEQWEIVQWVGAATRNIDASISGAGREIALLREYRTRLIADVVTGKLDVREAAARLPENRPEVEGSDATDDCTDEEPIEPDDADELATEETEA